MQDRERSCFPLALIDNTVPRRSNAIVELYVAAFERRSTGRQRSSALEHLEDLEALHPDDEQRMAIREIINGIDEHFAQPG